MARPSPGPSGPTTLTAIASRSEAEVRRDGTTTLAEEYAKCGKDWQTVLRQRAREVELARELGLSGAEASPATPR
ncbi:MAG: hypothetical protein KGY99_11040 [Phycisphaerae bacterium]|nr:hypothetical protein [Phycisphaerae bacterium]